MPDAARRHTSREHLSSANRRLGWSLGLKQRGAESSSAADELIREGFSVRALNRFMDALELSREEIASLLGISVRTLSRRQDQGRLTASESDRLYRYARLLERATDVLGSEEAARGWLKEPQWGLGDRIPLHFAQTEAGAREVEDLLGRLDYGVLA